MDRINQKILTFLQEDASISNAALAEQIGLAPSTCLRRVQALKEQGVIRRTVALLDAEKVNRSLSAIVDVRFASDNIQQRQGLIERLQREPAVSQIYNVTGDTDFYVVLNLHDMQEFKSLCDKVFDLYPIIKKYRTSFALECLKAETALPVLAS